MASSFFNVLASLTFQFAYSFVFLSCIISLVCLSFGSSVSFEFTRFDRGAPNILYDGDAAPFVGAIEFNNVDYLCRVGHAIYAERVPLWDSSSGKLTDFTTRFSFVIDTKGQPKYGHGIAFFLAPVGFQIPPNSAGGFLGLFNTTTSDSPQNHMLVVEFDSFSNPEWDPPFQHVGINNNSIASFKYTPWNASFHSGDFADTMITYNATTKNFTVSWSYRKTPNATEKTSLSVRIDLREFLPERVIVGFSAATGQYVESHTLYSWEFESSLDIQDSGGNNSRKISLIIGLTVPIGVLIIGGIIAVLILKKRRRITGKTQGTIEKPGTVNLTLTTSVNDDLERGAVPRRFSYIDLVLATNNFSDDRKLGEGGFGAVYKGHLSDLNREVAVKKISRGSKQGRKEYITEIKVISRLRHRNLVQLIGWCHDQGEFLLVYEFMPNGSLDHHLFGQKPTLTWVVRYKIALGLASALLYLHEEWEQCVVHRDVKSSNVMLDTNFNTKLGDFGLARLMDHELGPQTTGIAGTLGYLAPEYVNTGKPSKESDVYSFGVVALEIATGRKPADPTFGECYLGLVQWVWSFYETEQIVSAVDEKLQLQTDLDTKQAECLMMVGLWCAHPDRGLRPSIRQAIQVLNFEASMPNLPRKMPVATYLVPNESIGSSEKPFITNTSIDVGR